MRTPSDQEPIAAWAPHTTQARRSLFANYQTPTDAAPQPPSCDPDVQSGSSAPVQGDSATLQESINVALARSFVYRFLAKAFEDPVEDTWRILHSECRASLQPAVALLAPTAPALPQAAQALEQAMTAQGFETFLNACLAAFGHAARGRCPLNEIEYGDIKADPLFQPHRLADLAAFYRAFGLEVAEDAGERHDHICLELEFMCVLSAKEAYALEHQADTEDLSLCRAAQKKFLREHLGRWAPAFARRLRAAAAENALGALATFTGAFIASECGRFHVAPGSEDLLLRPVDEAGESLCTSCSLAAGPK